MTTISEDTNSSLTPASLYKQYGRYWYVFVLSVIICLAGAYWYLRYAVPIYQTSALLLIKESINSTGDAIIRDESNKRPRSVQNEIELLKSFTLLQRVVDDLGLTVGYYNQQKFGTDRDIYGNSAITIYPEKITDLAYSNPFFISIVNKDQYTIQDSNGDMIGNYSFDQHVATPIGTFRVTLNDSLNNSVPNTVKIKFLNREQVAQAYKATLKVALLDQNSTILKITLEDALPNRGKLVLGKLLEEYHYATLADKNLEATNTIKFIDERLRLITSELGTVEQSVESYKRNQHITDLSHEGQMFLANVNTNDTKINEATVQLSVLDGIDSYLQNSQTGSAPASSNDPMLNTLLHKLSELQTQQEKYARSMQPGNPFLKGMDTQIATTKTAIQENIASQRHNLQLELTSLTQRNDRFSSAIQTIPRKEREFITIKRQKDIKESLYLLLLQKKEETALQYASSVTDSRVVEEPFSSQIPIRPNSKNIYLVAFLASLLVPIGGLATSNLLSTRIRSRKDIESVTGIPVFGEIMLTPKSVKSTIIDTNTNRMIAEQFKMLRANLPYTSEGLSLGGQVILVTSSTIGEGKSFFSTNLAFSLAQLDKRVVVLELDLRNPRTTQYLGMRDGQTVGLSTYFNRQATLDDIVRETSLSPNLHLISSGPLPQNPAELLSNGTIGTLLTELRQQFDYVILDTPPVAFVADTIVLGPYADVSFYIVRQSYTPRSYMQLLASLEAGQKFKSLHVVFNGVAYDIAREAEYGYGYVHSNTK